MKKIFSGLISIVIFALTACSSDGAHEGQKLEKLPDLKHICIKEVENPQLPAFAKYIGEYLMQWNISSEIVYSYTNRYPKHCHYVLAYSLRAENGVIAKGKIRLSEIIGDKRRGMGSVGYHLKGTDEKARVVATGLKGQVKSMMDELLKNN
ncbi:hypothetical protein P7L91_10710 [Bisgaard Taxon 10/6]|uniref:hypothetical protein n=1 Tax=Exercitatus varius TaxID=67857 RepID=UPI00294B9044|nr:hypothetical protein [Exercitatus varius]MDG2961305.1 hypothetical protein [Exercitatus varius]